VRYSPNAKIAPQRHSSKGQNLGAPASGGVKGKAMDPPIAGTIRKLVHKRLGQLAKGKPWMTTGYGSMAATKVPSSGSVVRQGGTPEPSRGQKMTAASRNGQDTGPVSPSIVPFPKASVELADVPPMVRRGKGKEAHKGRSAPSFMAGGRRARQSY